MFVFGFVNRNAALFGAGEGDFSRAGEVADAEVSHEGEELGDFAFGAGDFDGEFFRLHIDDLGTENIANLHDVAACLRVGVHTQEDEFAVHVLFVAEILHADDIDQLLELFGDLLEHLIVTADLNGHARSGGIEGGADV